MAPRIEHSNVRVSDLLHLSGGMRGSAYGAPDSGDYLGLFPTADGQTSITNVAGKANFIRALNSLGLDFIGHEEVPLDDYKMSSVWFPFDPRPPGVAWITDTWRQISHGAKLEGAVDASENADYLAFALLASGLRLRDISREYGLQLEMAINANYQDGQQFANLSLIDLYLALHSFFVEMCTARDYLARFTSKHILKIKPVTRMSELSRQLIKSPENNTISKLILDACNRTGSVGWLTQLSSYRNLIAHEAPISTLSPKYGMTVLNKNLAGREFRQVKMEIPTDPKHRTGQVDALWLASQMMREMQNFARAIASASPFPAKMIIITDSDFVDSEEVMSNFEASPSASGKHP